MAKQVADDLVKMFPSKINPLFVDELALSEAINKNLFHTQLVSSQFFSNKTLEEAIEIVYKIICLSIDQRCELLTFDKANMLFRDIMIQALDKN